MLVILQNIQSSENILIFFPSQKIKFCLRRKQRRRQHSTTPNKYRKCSRCGFDGQLRTPYRNLHEFDKNTKEDPTGTNEIIDINENVELILTE
jgi:hypothetical protein